MSLSDSFSEILNLLKREHDTEYQIQYKQNLKILAGNFAVNANAQISLKLQISQNKKDYLIEIPDLPLYAYQSAYSRLFLILRKVKYLETTNDFTVELLIDFCSEISNIIHQFGENTLIRAELYISDKLPKEIKNELIIFIGPINDVFVVTVNSVSIQEESKKRSDTGSALWRPLIPGSDFDFNGRKVHVFDTVSVRINSKIQTQILHKLKALKSAFEILITEKIIEMQSAE